MLRTISGTFISKFLLALLNFCTIILSTRLLGAEGRGEISFFGTNMVLVLLFTSLIGGPSLVYLTPRHNFFRFLIPTYAWTVVVTGVFCCFLYQTNQLAIQDFAFLFSAILFNSWKSTNMMVLLGKEKMKAWNWLALMHSVLLILFFLLFYFSVKIMGPSSFYWGLVLSNVLIWAWSFWLLFDLGEKVKLNIDRQLIKQLMAYGGLAQLANILQFANYRISYYYFMNMHAVDSAAELGKYSIAVSIAESVWIIGQSLATVQFSRLSNIEEPELRRKISVRMFKFNFLLNLLAVLVLLCVPSFIYKLVFGGEEFAVVSTYIYWLALGIFMLGTSTSISAYFGGRGKYLPAVISSLVGNVITFFVCVFFMKDWGAIAAAIAASLSYTAIAVYFLVCFLKEEKLSLYNVIPGLKEVKLYYRWLKGGMYRWSNR
ncbi:MAG: polysaccharide biosynthesis C-terminal domain-containing protein [Cytophagaceae bacterium]|nr:polysaccharide biosynthesis C-terminal domain-containing protein [Cytophagaceae bacterium]